MPKYHNRKTVLDGLTFDSAAEAARWRELTLLEKAGHIRDLQRQVPIELVPGARLHGEKRARPAIRLVVDFAIPASWSMKKQRAADAGLILPKVKPDADNVIKAVCDAINGVVWVDDVQVVDLTLKKRYSMQPGVAVRIDEVGAQ